MKAIISSVLFFVLMQGITVMADPVSLTNNFQPGTSAKASEVNANFNALAQAIQDMQRTYLYQNDVKIGKARLLNLIKLNSGYLILPYKRKGSSTIYLKGADSEALYYASNNCTGSPYVEFGTDLNIDLILGDNGFVFSVQNQAYYMNTPAANTPDFFFNSFKNISTGVCKDVSEWVYPSVPECMAYVGMRIKQVPNGVGGYTCQPAPWQHNPPDEACVFDPSPDGVNFMCHNIYSLDNGYSITPNDVGVTGVTTTACTKDLEPAVCLPNAYMQAE